ncbi:GumC family protein [Geobacter anodireducens]|uniref:Lipopolysaccharide biosynthesis protein n=1 Tax=Geobacter anodireducens TaxID=1340425 RepID=A0ABR9NQU8_9BACT|nr:GNVR domain-containing protein [Geobacter anodireducens]MBE2886644.1 lipopolysaccharide biosynthesis protein [Geobacter anodireducens]
MQGSQPGNNGTTNETINLLDYLEVLAKRKSLIVRTTLAVFVLSVCGSLLLTKIYSTTALVLPPQQDQSLMGLMIGQVGGGMANLAGDLLGNGTSADRCIGILKSNAVSDDIIDRYNLMKVFNAKSRDDVYKTLGRKVDIVAGKKDGIISITVEDKDPRLAADIANAYVDELAKMMINLNVTGAVQNKAYLAEQLAKTKVSLSSAEEKIKGFKAKNKMVDVTEQAKGAIQGIADLTAQLAAEQVKLAVLQRSLTDSSQEVKNQKVVIDRLREQIAHFEGNGKGGAIPSVGSVPALGEEYLRLMRDFKIQESLVELLTKQYEMAKLTEEMNVAGIQVIQRARVPDKKAKPKRSAIVLMGTLLGLMGSTVAAFLIEYRERMTIEERQRWQYIFSLVKGE